MEMNWKLYRVAILTASDKGAAGKREDLSGPAAKEIMEQALKIVENSVEIAELRGVS